MLTMQKTVLCAALALLASQPALAATPSCPQNTWDGAAWGEYQPSTASNSGAYATGSASGEAYWTTTGNNTNDNSSIPSSTASGYSERSVSIGAADVGYYKVEALVLAPTDDDDSLFVGFTSVADTCAGGGAGSGSGAPGIRRWDIQNTGSWAWRYVTDWNNTNDFSNARVWYLSAGTYTLRLVGRENGALIARVRLRRLLTAPTPTPTPVLTPPALGTGLCAQYFSNMTLSGGPDTTRTDSQVSFNWAGGAPLGTGLPFNGFSVRWSGQVEFPEVGNYVFYTYSDDGVRLWVNGALVLDHWANQSATEWASTAIAVTASGKANLTLEYFENTGQAAAELRWASGSIAKQAVPANRLYPSCGGLPTATPTPPSGGTATPSPLPSNSPTAIPTVWAGLPAGKRLNGLEYIPFPSGRIGSNYIHPLSLTFSSAAGNDNVHNTARWRIVLSGLASTVGGQVQVETRLGADGEACVSGAFEPAAYASATSLTLPQRPQNLSSTYFWVNANVPYTERFDAVGDPRYVPYADLIGAPGNSSDWQGGYNWYFKDMRDGAWTDHEDEYEPFLPMAVNNRYNGQPNFDIPKLFGLWREAVVASRSIYTSMTGYSSYYVGLGGEIGGDSANKLSAGGVPCYSGPWGGSGSGGKEEIIGSATLVRNANWRSMPQIGELWPDASYGSDWSSNGSNAAWGNLRNNQQGGTAYRQALQSLGSTAYGYPQVRHRTETQGCASFMNGHGGSGQFNHFTNQFNASLLYDGGVMAQDYNFAMPATFNVNRSWGLVQGGNQPAEWNEWPYKDRRLALEIYSAAAGQASSSWGFYKRDGGVDASQRASSAVRAVDSSGIIDPAGKPAAGWFVINGLAPSTDSGINFVARFAILSCLRTFHDAGAPTVTGTWGGQSFSNARNKIGANTYRIGQVPLVQITWPKVGQDVTGQPRILLQWKARSARWDGARYTENYPCLDADLGPCKAADPTKPEKPALEWHDDAVLVFNVKYSLNGGKDWYSALTDAAAQPGVYMDGADSLAANGASEYQYDWDVTGLPDGAKLLRVESYRRDLGLHYAYHEMSLKTAP